MSFLYRRLTLKRLVRGKELAVIKKLAGTVQEKVIPIEKGKLREILHELEKDKATHRRYELKTQHATLQIIAPGTETKRIYLIEHPNPEKESVKHINPSKHAIVVKHFGSREELAKKIRKEREALLGKTQRALFEFGEPVPEVLGVKQLKDKRIALKETAEGYSIAELAYRADDKEREVLWQIFIKFEEQFRKRYPKLPSTHAGNILINPKTGKVTRIDLSG